MKPTEISILTYHSISEGTGPTCISPRLFREHLDVLEACQYKVVHLAKLADCFHGKRALPPRSVVITFDDAFADFASIAFPELKDRGWPATLFLPTSKIGGTNDWQQRTNHTELLPLMSWRTVAELGHQGIELGAHAMSHKDLTQMSQEAARDEIVNSRVTIESITGCTVASFAPPYGRTNRNLREQIRKRYSVAVGTRLARAQPDSDLYNLPRIEMCYFRNSRRWREYLEHGPTSYYRIRKLFRALRAIGTQFDFSEF